MENCKNGKWMNWSKWLNKISKQVNKKIVWFFILLKKLKWKINEQNMNKLKLMKFYK